MGTHLWHALGDWVIFHRPIKLSNSGHVAHPLR